MPIIEVDRLDLSSLVGEWLDDETLKETLDRTKMSLEDIAPDKIVIEVTSDRMDLLTTEGIARAIRGVLGKERGIPRYEMVETDITLSVDSSVKSIRPFAVGAVVFDVNLTDEVIRSLIQAQEKLHDTIGRNRRRVAIGIHDLDKVVPPIKYAARPMDEVFFVPLGQDEEMSAREVLERTDKGRKYSHLIENEQGLVPLILDSRDRVMSLPPVINSEMTRVTDKTRNLFFDVTGTDEKSIRIALNILVYSLGERGCKIGKIQIMDGEKNFHQPERDPKRMSVPLDFVRKMSGLNLSSYEIIDLLRRARLDAAISGDRVDVLIPPFRPDFLHPVDVIEEILVVRGLNEMEPVLPERVSTIGRRHPIETLSLKVRTLMIGLGYQQVLNYVLTDEEILLRRMRRNDMPVRLLNPVSSSFSVVRDMLLPGLLSFLSRNIHSKYPQKVFEVGDVVKPELSRPTRARTERHLAAVYSDDSVGFEDIQSHLHCLLKSLKVSFELEERAFSFLIEGRSASIISKERSIGFIGEVRPEILKDFGLNTPVAAFEIVLGEII